MPVKKSIKQQLKELDIELMENQEISFEDSYCPVCEEPTAVRTAAKPYELKCRFCLSIFTEN